MMMTITRAYFAEPCMMLHALACMWSWPPAGCCRSESFLRLLPLTPPEVAAASVDPQRTWRVTLVHHDGAQRPHTIGVEVLHDVRLTHLSSAPAFVQKNCHHQ